MANLPKNPETSTEQYLAALAGQSVALPDHPIDHVERYLEAAVERVSGFDEDISDVKESISQLETGKADLENGKVKISQMPSVVVADVIEVNTYADLPAVGTAGVKYYVKATGITYKWLGEQYREVNEKNGIDVLPIGSASYTMGTLKEVIDEINENGEHAMFDMHFYSEHAPEGYLCLIHFYGTGKCEIIDFLGLQIFGIGKTYTDDMLVSDYLALGKESFATNGYLAEYAWSKAQADARFERKFERYGIRVDLNDSNPSTRVSYMFDAVGKRPAHMDFANGRFDFGDWADAWFIRGNFPCMVKADGSVDYKLDPNDYTKKADGTASDVANTAYNGNAMAAIPTVWVRRYTDANYYYIVFCNYQYDSSYDALAHERYDGNISPYAFFPMFEGSTVSGKLRSLSGQRPMNSQTGTTELQQAQANDGLGSNSRWGIRNWLADELVYDLLKLISKSTNLQASFGQGHSTGWSSVASLLDTGTLKDKGQFFGYSSTDKAVKFFHIENFYADRWDRQEGMVYDNGIFKVAEHIKDSNFAGTGYHSMEYGLNTNGYQVKLDCTKYGSFPKSIGGSDATYECDYYYQNSSGVRVPLSGGACGDGAFCGRYVYVSSGVGGTDGYIGASPFLKNPL